MSDLIDRQVALDALRSCQTYLFDAEDPDKKIELKSAELAIEDLPAVQPDHIADIGKKVSIPCAHENDLIFRQAAIDAVSEYATIWMSYTDDMSASDIAQEAINSAKDTMIRILKNQPNVQPEIIRCKDCKFSHMTNDGRYCKYCDQFTDTDDYGELVEMYFDSDFYCGYAERRING